MGLIEDLTPDSNRQPWQVCGVAWATEAAGEDGPVIQSAVANPLVSPAQIAEAVRDHLGLGLSVGAVRRHRLRQCRCEQ